MNIIFRCDSSIDIGTGHVMRCLTLADALGEEGAECHFICREHNGHLADKIKAAGHTVQLLPQPVGSKRSKSDAGLYAAWLGCSWQQDARQTANALEDEYDWLVVDHYGLDARWESSLRDKAKRILVIDDLANRPHDCDLLLDQNLVFDQDNRYKSLVPEGCSQLIGPAYALLQPQYGELQPRTPPRQAPVQRVLVYFGGSDNYNLTWQTIAAFQASNRTDIVLEVVVSANSQNANAIRELAQAHDNIVLHEALPSLAPLMLKADIAIGAGGTTSWERCCLGLPSLIITIADNQRAIAEALDSAGAAKWLGDYDTIDQTKLIAAINEYLDASKLAAQSRRCMELVDGKGRSRLAACILLDAATELTARHAILTDEELLFRWANDPSVRQNAYNSNPIAPETHRDWFYQRLRQPDACAIYIVETAGGFSIGQVRFELNSGGGWEIDYALDAVARGRKLGAKLLQTAIRTFRSDQPGALVFGRVKEDNVASKRSFERAGFSGTPVKGGGSVVYRHLLG